MKKLFIILLSLGLLNCSPSITTVELPDEAVNHGYEIEKLYDSQVQDARMFQAYFDQYSGTSGRSEDRMNITFEDEVCINGVLISVDIWSMELVEFSVGISPDPAYDLDQDSIMLFHVSSVGENTEIDESIMFDDCFIVTPDEKLVVGAWLQNSTRSHQSVSPEVIIYYEWMA